MDRLNHTAYVAFLKFMNFLNSPLQNTKKSVLIDSKLDIKSTRKTPELVKQGIERKIQAENLLLDHKG